MGFAALCLKDFIDWRYIHSWLVFFDQLVKLEEFYTLFFNKFRTYKIAAPSQTKKTNKDDI
jgi:hypothetical protein